MLSVPSSRSRVAGFAVALALGCTSEAGPSDDGGSGEPTTGSTSEDTTDASMADAGASEPGESTTNDTLDTASADDADPTAGTACDLETHACLPAPPEGWSGPGAISQSNGVDAAHCGAAYPTVSLSAFAQFDAGEAECECTCGEATGGICSGTGSVQSFPIQDYPSPFNMNIQGCTVADGGPVQLPGDGTGVSFSVSKPGRVLTDANVSPSGGSCPPTVMPSIEVPTFGRRIDACSAVSTESTCDDAGVCVPKILAPFEGHCIWRVGEHECPSDGPYTQRMIAHQSHTDTRVCGGCTCELPTGSCAPKVWLWRLGADVELPADGTCSQLTDGYALASLKVGAPQWTSCAPAGGTVTGTAAPADPVTFCCT